METKCIFPKTNGSSNIIFIQCIVQNCLQQETNILYKIVNLNHVLSFKCVAAPNKHCALKTWGGEGISLPPLNFDTKWTPVFLFIEAFPISGQVCVAVDMVVKRKFADAVGNRTTELELVSGLGGVRGYVF